MGVGSMSTTQLIFSPNWTATIDFAPGDLGKLSDDSPLRPGPRTAGAEMGESNVARMIGENPFLYRYDLRRIWGTEEPIRVVNFIMLNPSTADAEQPDPTMTRCLNFARDWGYGALVITNLFAFRATDPQELRTRALIVGPLNDKFLLGWARSSQLVVCAWGNHGTLRGAGAYVAKLLRADGIKLHALRITGLGQPQHPLYLPADSQPVLWEPMA